MRSKRFEKLSSRPVNKETFIDPWPEVGLIAAEVFRRSGSVCPAVIVHVVVNLPTVSVMVFASMG